jgi:hypothetical protein
MATFCVAPHSVRLAVAMMESDVIRMRMRMVIGRMCSQIKMRIVKEGMRTRTRARRRRRRRITIKKKRIKIKRMKMKKRTRTKKRMRTKTGMR